MDCVCPRPAEIQTISASDCPEDLNQLQRIFFQRNGQGSFADETTGLGGFAAVATWTPLFAVGDDTKITKTPLFENFVIPQGEPITEGGGDNTTLNGETVILGVGPIQASGMFRSIKNAIIKELRDYTCESAPGQSPGLGLFFANEYGKLIGKQPGGAGTAVNPIPVTSFFVSDAGNDGKNTNDKASFRFNFKEGWRDDLIIVTPNFDPLTV